MNAYRPGREIVLAPHDALWRTEFDRAADELRPIVRDTAVAIHHIGSTAIPGIVAKPVIDILLVVTDLDGLDHLSPRIEDLGYEARGEWGIRGRRYFARTAAGVRRHQIHAFAEGDHQITRHLAFRDYLRAHADAAIEYDALKRALAAKFQRDIERYSDAKSDFIEGILRLALRSSAD